MDGLEPWENETSTATQPMIGVVEAPFSAYTTRRVSVARKAGPATRFTATGIVGSRASPTSTSPSAVNQAPSITSAERVPPGAAMLDREVEERAARRDQPGTAASAGILATTRMEAVRFKEARHSTGVPRYHYLLARPPTTTPPPHPPL